MTVDRRRGIDLLAPAEPGDPAWDGLRELVGSVAGTVKSNRELRWREGVGLSLDWADDRPWALIEPRIVFDGLTQENRAMATDFARERTVRRYNAPLNDLIGYWASRLSHKGEELRALNISSGIDAVFRLGTETAYSRRT
jgi:hypothetical protein